MVNRLKLLLLWHSRESFSSTTLPSTAGPPQLVDLAAAQDGTKSNIYLLQLLLGSFPVLEMWPKFRVSGTIQ